MRVVARDGSERIWSYHNVRHDCPGEPPYVIGSALDLTEQFAYGRRLQDVGLRDPLTGCFNRRILERLEAEWGPRSWSCLYLDIDGFKAYNDRFGHPAGDDVLVQMGRYLAGHVRAGDPVVRMGGKEFLVLLRGADEAVARAVAGRLQSVAAGKAPTSFSLGWAARAADERLAQTIERADQGSHAVHVAEHSFEARCRESPDPRTH